jgi:hypothetical protein
MRLAFRQQRKKASKNVNGGFMNAVFLAYEALELCVQWRGDALKALRDRKEGEIRTRAELTRWRFAGIWLIQWREMNTVSHEKK